MLVRPLLTDVDCGVCRVRSWKLEDAAPLVRYANNHKIWLNVRDRFPHPYTFQDAQDWLTGAGQVRPETQFAIDMSGEAIGGIGFDYGSDVERFSAEVGYWLGEPFWGRGVMTSILKIFVPYAFETLKLIRVYALPFSENRASIRVLEKAGFQLEGILRKSAVKDGRILDQALYARTKGSTVPGSSLYAKYL